MMLVVNRYGRAWRVHEIKTGLLRNLLGRFFGAALLSH
ncbi:hypothetical protein E6C60_3417 [Paenibacillus algicola]|uniref:Uncharacterized protein n=1 Tax=Paenibacillus algicola TaxID=2565926 RepID=A0A4P8XNH2_9BACL|nr:hypothetical protein E6C60_3417 [Paenibacillus algicola]